ncbi:hypothetical protein MKX78_10765 [Cytobacillus sp. FSL R5-0569]|uniref:phage tail assembly chaperone G n=1 Tax=Cytobacillus sp. FSL R5-0569 TaxID=2921649 RepID=UPI0030F9E975
MATFKRNMIELVTGVREDGEYEIKKYFTPNFIPFSIVYEAVDLNEKMVKNKFESEKAQFDELLEFVTNRIYGNQFSKEDLLNGLHAPEAISTLENQITFIAQGKQSDETKKFLAKKH